MAVMFQPDPAHTGRWFVSQSEHDEPQIGAQLVSTPNEALTVYWHGHLARRQLIKIVVEAQQALVKDGLLTEAKLTAYGKNLREEISFAKDSLAENPNPSSALAKFDACRAELTGPAGRVIVWANVMGKPKVGLNWGGENIGVSVPPGLFDGPVRRIISNAIKSTMDLQLTTITTLLDKISQELLKKHRPVAG